MATTSNALIRVEGVSKVFPNGVHALDNCSLEIQKGEVVVIVGPSGSGKSTMLRSLNLLEEPTDGKIFFEDHDITDKKTNINLHRQKMGMVFQHFNLFPNMTVLKNLTLALTGTYTGSMLVEHHAGMLESNVTTETRDFWDMGIKAAYDFKVYRSFSLQLNAGVQNMFNSFQNDFDSGADRDSGYIYGPTLPRNFFFGIKLMY